MEMRDVCEKCNKKLSQDGIAFICSYECTFCQECTTQMQQVCPNCSGELLRRPKRVIKKNSMIE
jgi:hypothetical protein